MNNLQTLILCLTVLVCGCVSPRVLTNNTAFYLDDYYPRGSIAVFAANAGLNNSLEFMAYKRKFEVKLSENGYSIETEAGRAEFIALIAYGIDEGKTATVRTPVFGHVGGGVTYSKGTVSGTDKVVKYNRSTYSMPAYAVIGSSTRSSTSYKRAIALDIVEADSFRAGKPRKLYEGRTHSIGSCSVIVEVFDEMLEAMFDQFPGENGRNRKLDIAGEINC